MAYDHAGELPLLVDIFSPVRPASATPTPTPVLLVYHGGALILGDRKLLDPAFDVDNWVGARGWTLLSFDYRLLPDVTLLDINEDILKTEHFVLHKLTDTLTALGKPAVDLSQVAVGGGSAGGYIALQAGHLFRELRVRVVAAMYPMTFAFRSFWAEEHPDSRALAEFIPYDWQGSFWRMAFRSDALPADLPSEQRRLLPALNVSAEYPPTIIVHGTADDSVPMEDSDDVIAALAAAGVEHKYVRVEGRDHAWDLLAPDDNTAQAAWTQIADFVLAHMNVKHQ